MKKLMNKRHRKIKISAGDRVFYFFVDFFLLLCFVIVMYPVLNVLASSFSNAGDVMAGRVKIFPVHPTLLGYKAVFENTEIWMGYANSLFYMVVGTLFNLFMTVLCAYPLSRKDLNGKKWITLVITFTMIFGGGIIPSYILMQRLHLLNTRWVMIIPGAIGVSNMVICKNFFATNLSNELLDAAQIDGASDFKYLVKIALPLSKSILAVLTLYYAVGHWNSYFNAMIYLSDSAKYPLQLVLRKILLLNEVNLDMIQDPILMANMEQSKELIKYSLIVVSSLPVLIMYPFVQKYFISGRMAGAVKG